MIRKRHIEVPLFSSLIDLNARSYHPLREQSTSFSDFASQ
jgi:hypothetical protein